MKAIKYILSSVALAVTGIALACWYQKADYNDYIAVVNNSVKHTVLVEKIETSSAAKAIRYTIDNQMTVDFPVTVTMKLTSEQPIIIDDAFSLTANVAAQPQPSSRISKIQAVLEYRVLPNGSWVKVSEYSIETGRLPDSYPPAAYLGRNNIWPRGLSAGDKIMVRLYVTDGQWQSGDPDSKCDARATTPEREYRYDFPHYEYIVQKTGVIDVEGESDLGGGWLPQYVVVLEYSGKTRPIN